MFKKEAQEIGAWLARIPTEELSPFVNLGSGSKDFREREKPWVQSEIFAPLEARGVHATHIDIFEAPGVDMVANVLEDAGFERVRALAPKMLLLSNVLEHVYEPQDMVARCLRLLAPGGRLFITVPRDYPHHGVIDTMLRPTPEEVAAWAPQAKLEMSGILDAEYHWHEIWRNPRKAMIDKTKWLFTPYKVSMLVLAPG